MVELREKDACGQSSTGVKDPVAAYRGLLEDERLAASSAEILVTGQREGRLAFGERPLCVALRPQLLTRKTFDQAVAASQGVSSALANAPRPACRRLTSCCIRSMTSQATTSMY